MTEDTARQRIDLFLKTGEASVLQTAAEVVAAAHSWNYGNGNEGPRALLEHHRASLAAALSVYWLVGSDLLADCRTVEEAADEFSDEAAQASRSTRPTTTARTGPRAVISPTPSRM